MLKKIEVQDLRLGMHLHALDGPWLAHAFWKTRFVIDDPKDLQLLRAGSVKQAWIDINLGLDVIALAGAALPAPQRRAHPVAPPVQASPSAGAQAPRSLEEELHAAAAVCKRGRAAVQSMFNEARLGHAVDAQACLPLVNDITASVYRNPGALVSLARLKTQDDYTYMHSVAVCALMVALGKQLGLDDAQCREAGLAGLLHDLGKAALPQALLNKPGKLSEAEFTLVRTHPQRGFEMLEEGRGASAAALEVCLQHHEKMDGRGYPQGLQGTQISTLARMGAVCDVYDAITSNRPYKTGWDPGESIARMASWQGHFDADLFKAFVHSLGIYPVGSLVRLESQRLGVVVEQNPHSLVAPVVKVFYALKTQMPINPKRLDLGSPVCSDRIVARELAANWGFVHTDDLWASPEVRARSRSEVG